MQSMTTMLSSASKPQHSAANTNSNSNNNNNNNNNKIQTIISDLVHEQQQRGSATCADATHWNPGVLIDIDGVVLQGGKPFEWSKEALKALFDNKIPFTFVTNGTYSTEDFVRNMCEIFNLPFNSSHVVVAPSPCSGLEEFHHKRVLVCCQNESIPLIDELGFTDYLTVDQFSEVFPDLDYVDHQRRKELMKMPVTPELLKAQREFRPIEAILLLGEPIYWERSLQLLIDVLMTNGDPRQKFKYMPDPHVPIIACNKDLTFKGAASLPRFGHGAFLECLQALYMKITKNELVYEEIMGKPFLITYEYAAKQLQKQDPHGRPINKFYIIGDNPEVDIKGANMFLEDLRNSSEHGNGNGNIKMGRGPSRKASRSIEPYLWNPEVSQQPVESILVCTGVYNPQNDMLYYLRKLIKRKESTSIYNAINSSTASITLADNSNSNSISNSNDANNNYCGMEHKSGDSSKSSSAVEVSLTPLEEFDEENQRTIRPNNNSYPRFQTGLSVDKSRGAVEDELNEIELTAALSRRNSFISYFDDHQNVPDHTFDNLKCAVDYILESLGLSQQQRQ